MTLYAEPPPAFRHISLLPGEPHLARLKSATGHVLEVSHIADVGWCLELRLDELLPDVRRQPFSGKQAECHTDSVAASERDGLIVVACGEQSLTVRAETGVLELRDGGTTALRTFESPFHLHPEARQLYSNFLSLKYTDLTSYKWYPGNLFETRMIRFQYARPEGTVLGVPSHVGEWNRNGYRFELFNSETMHVPNRRAMHQSWPMLAHAAAEGGGMVGVFYDNPSHTFVDVGDFYKDRVTFESVTGNARVYLATGAAMADITRKWLTLLGTIRMPPLWAFGYQQSRWGYRGTREIREVAARLREEEMPCDAMYFDIDYMDAWKDFTVDPKHFGDMREAVRALNADGFHAVCIVDPGIKIEEGYAPYEELKASGAYFKNADGTDLVGSVWPGKVLYPDFGSPTVQEWWAAKQRDFLKDYGFSGVWNDMNEPVNWDGGPFKTSKAVTERGVMEGEWNLYGYHMAKTSQRGWEEYEPGKRSLIITRSGYPGVQRHAVSWHGDNQAWWEHIRLALETAVSYSVCGAFYQGPDVPGFSENAPSDLAVRFFQLGSVLPFFRGHSMIFAEDKESYAYPEPAKSLIRDAIRLRYALMAEWYSGFERCIREKTSPLEPTFDDKGHLVKDQLLLFGKLLACPVTQRDETMKKIWLPDGEWYEFGDPENRIEGGRYVLRDVSDMSMPLYVKAGSILVMHEPRANTALTLAGKPSFHAYPDARGHAEGYLYVDDGISVKDPGAKRFRLALTKDGSVEKKDVTDAA